MSTITDEERRDIIIAWQLEDATLDEVAHYFIYHADQTAEETLSASGRSSSDPRVR